MKPLPSFFTGLGCGIALLAAPLLAEVDLPHRFSGGETASASEVNANFDALVSAVEELQARVEALEGSDVHALDDYLEVFPTSPDDTAANGPLVRFTGANVQVVNGAGSDPATGLPEPNGIGNLIVGYALSRAEIASSGSEICSDGQFDNQADCEAAGATWGLGHESGSHNFVGGLWPAYSQTGGAVLGSANAATATGATVLGGSGNVASGTSASVLGGNRASASGQLATVAGGEVNTASGLLAHVAGGFNNEASARATSVLGGDGNDAVAERSTVAGGRNNTAGDTATGDGTAATVAGGQANIATGTEAAVGGGFNCTVASEHGWGAADTGECP